MKQIQTYKMCGCLVVMMLLLAACKNNKRKLPQMNPRFVYRDKGPMGTNIAYRLLPTQFNSGIQSASKKMNGYTNELLYIKNTVYVNVGKTLVLDSEQIQQLLMYAERGNEVFLSDEAFDYRLLDTLGIKYNSSQLLFEGDSPGLKNTTLRIADTATYGKNQFGFFYFPFINRFTTFDTSTTQVLGVNEKGLADYIVTRYGKGKIYLHAEPAAFSNYFLLTKDNTEYYKQVFSYLNKDARSVYWADTPAFGNNKGDFSALSIFWQNKMLLYALLLFCALMLLYIAFGSKRKRRLIPVLPPNTNESLSFVHTIGNLYLQKKDNRNIALKMMTYFFEHVRNNYYLSTASINTEFIQSLSRKSGVAEKKVQELMDNIELVNNAETITDPELFNINNLIYEFYKK